MNAADRTVSAPSRARRAAARGAAASVGAALVLVLGACQAYTAGQQQEESVADREARLSPSGQPQTSPDTVVVPEGGGTAGEDIPPDLVVPLPGPSNELGQLPMESVTPRPAG